MRNIVLLLLVLVFSVAAQAQWKWLSPRPSGYHNTKITFTDVKHGFLFNSNGDLFETVDTGNTWKLQQRFPNTTVFDLKDSTGLIGGFPGVIYISEDNGQSWQRKDIDSVTAIVWIDIINRDTIFLHGANNRLYRSVTRGKSWELMSSTFYFRPQVMDFVSAQTGFAVIPASNLYKTVDGGRTWNLINQSSYSVQCTAIKFADSLHGYAYRETDTILRTSDGGKTWTAGMHAPERVYDIFIINAKIAFAVGELGVIYKTVDGGATWTSSVSSDRVRNGLNSVYFINENTGFAAGNWGTVLKTRNGGVSWQEYSDTYYADLSALSMTSPATGYAMSRNNLYRTTDSGNTWQPLPLTVGANYTRPSGLNNCHFFNADTGLVTSYDYVRIYRTENGGQSFDTIKPFQYDEDAILGMNFINASQGWCTLRSSMGGQYKVYKTQDGGRKWNEISSASNGPKKIYFVNEAVGYGAQYGGIVQTLDSGKTWSLKHMDYDNAYNSIWFINAKKGFAAGEHHMLKMTSDSGRTWTSITINDFYDDYTDLRFFSDSIGYVTGYGGGIFKTIDGGLTWKRRALPPFYDYHSYQTISFTSDSSVYIAGSAGSILKSSMVEVVADSLQAKNSTACTTVLSAKITADLCLVDSIWFQYGVNQFNQSVAASPTTVINGAITLTAPVQNLTANTAYRVRVKVFYRGKNYYSDEMVFKTGAIIIPAITVNNYVLTSSIDTGNQWFRNDTLIPGAINKQYLAKISGSYKVRVLNGHCPAGFSQPVQITIAQPPVTGVIDPVMYAELNVYPNPVIDHVNIYNEKQYRLTISVTEITGQQVIYLNNTRDQLITLPAGRLSRGIYLLHITDLQTRKMITRKLVKL